MFSFATKLAPEKTSIARAEQAGFEAAEVWLSGAHLENLNGVVEALAQGSLKWALHFPNRGELTEEQVANAVRLHREVGARIMVIHPPMLRAHGPRLRALGQDLILAVENGVLTPEQFDAWASTFPHLNLDVEHLWKFTLEDAPLERLMEELTCFWDRHGGKVRHVHLPGYAPGREEHLPAYSHPALMEQVWTFFRQRGYGGMAVSELNREFQTPLHLRRDMALFRRWLRGETGESPAAGLDAFSAEQEAAKLPDPGSQLPVPGGRGS